MQAHRARFFVAARSAHPASRADAEDAGVRLHTKFPLATRRPFTPAIPANPKMIECRGNSTLEVHPDRMKSIRGRISPRRISFPYKTVFSHTISWLNETHP